MMNTGKTVFLMKTGVYREFESTGNSGVMIFSEKREVVRGGEFRKSKQVIFYSFEDDAQDSY